jgi:lipoate-protein ligase A
VALADPGRTGQLAIRPSRGYLLSPKPATVPIREDPAVPIRILRSTDTNPWFNLATEDWIFRDLDPSVPVLFLWRNQPNIVIGRHQNPWRECDLEKMEAQGVLLTRRQSGGGAVYQDLGNSCFTFLAGKATYSRDRNFELLVRTLARFGIEAEVSGRNDITVEGRKVSGNAFKEAPDRAFHHGTMLLHVDLGRLGELLRPDPRKLSAKGIASVRSRVANLREFCPDLDHDRFCDALADVFREHHQQDAPVEQLDRSDLEHLPALAEHYALQQDWNWRFGATPDFAHHLAGRFDWGLIDVHLDTRKGHVSRAQVFSDTLHPDMIDLVSEHLPGTPYRGPDIQARLVAVADGQPWAAELRELAGWLDAQIG